MLLLLKIVTSFILFDCFQQYESNEKKRKKVHLCKIKTKSRTTNWGKTKAYLAEGLRKK